MKSQQYTLAGVRWIHSRWWAICLIALYLAVACLAVVLAWVLLPRTGASVWRELSRAAALLGFSLMALQFALAGRLKAVDQPFGLDIVLRFHRVMGIFAGLLFLAHPLLLIVDHGDLRILSLEVSWRISIGRAALVLLVLVITLAVLFRRLGLDYQAWHVSHKAVVVVLVLGFVHSLVIGSDLKTTPMRTYWWILFAVTMALFAHRNILVPLWGRRRYSVTDVRQETHDTYTIALESVDGKPLPHSPGQFWFLRLHRPGRRSEEHPFTISSSPTGQPPLTSTIKQCGNFTNTIGETRPGDRASTEGPYGRFSFVHDAPEAFVFIAGGVGITPVLSMLRYLRDVNDRRPAVLIYANKTEGDIICREELDRLPAHVRVVYVLDDASETWPGPRGYVTTDLIGQCAGDLLDTAHIYLCGPPAMMDAVASSLSSLGVADSRVHSERFTF